MSIDEAKDLKTSRSIFDSFKLGIMAGLIFSAGYFVAKATTKTSPPENIASQHLGEEERFKLAQEEYERVQERLKLKYYQELTSNSEPDTKTVTNVAPRKQPNIKDEKPSSDKMAKALARVLGKSTPETVSEAVDNALPSQTGSPYAVQVASLMDRKAAEELTNKLTVKGYAARLLQAELPDRGIVYRVRIHGFQNKEDADKARDQISQKESVDAITVAQDAV